MTKVSHTLLQKYYKFLYSLVEINSVIYHRFEVPMLKGTNEANCDGHFFGSHVKNLLWQGTREQST